MKTTTLLPLSGNQIVGIQANFNPLLKSIILFLFLLINREIFSTNYTVSTVSDFNTKVGLLQAGDTLFLKNQTWSNAVLTFDPPNAGTPTKNIVLAAQTPGKAIFTGTSRISIFGKYLTVTGLRFMNGGDTGGSQVIKLGDHSTSYNRVTNCSIESYNYSGDNHWVGVYGHHNRVDHCYFYDKINSNPTMEIYYNSSTSASTYNTIDYNYFNKRTMPSTNEGESIRVGLSTTALTKGFNIIENNLFENTLKEPEVISNKSCDNTIRYNTFRGNDGGITLRHGHRALVEGNYIYGKTGRGESRGIRVMGDGNVIINNYIEEVEGGGSSAIRAAISVIGGASGGSYLPSKDAIIAFNTIVNCAGASIRVGVDQGGTTAPVNLTIANNIVFGTKSSTSTPIQEDNAPSSKKYEGNLYYGVGSTSLAGWTKSTASLLTLTSGTYRPSSSSPAIDASKGTYSASLLNTFTNLKADMDGGPRTGIWDVGADEYGVSGNAKQPLQANDVGPCWMRTPGCSSVLTTTEPPPSSFDEIRDAVIYPNPCNGMFTIDLSRLFSDAVSIEIMDITGRLVLQLTDIRDLLKEVSIPGDKRGSYIVKIQTGEKIINKKIIVY